ncbi:hypothetical protein TRVA0_046S00584 [Trichomonascus vanleenenianus]|uniref:uncharacterized protein n=1 Tax=Trichomonascus vanleenenianus TaxID=2268995 RepID=UPI003EC95C86
MMITKQETPEVESWDDDFDFPGEVAVPLGPQSLRLQQHLERLRSFATLVQAIEREVMDRDRPLAEALPYLQHHATIETAMDLIAISKQNDSATIFTHSNIGRAYLELRQRSVKYPKLEFLRRSPDDDQVMVDMDSVPLLERKASEILLAFNDLDE